MTEEELLITIFKQSILGQPLQTLDFNMQRLWDRAGFHSVRAIIAHNLLQTNFVMSREWIDKWKEAKYKNIRKAFFFRTEREKIYKKLDDEGIWHIPLKGILLDSVYPKFGIREFSDNDIWIDSNRFDNLERIMEDMGYRRYSSSSDVHYSFQKEPFYNFEFHYRLFSDENKFNTFNEYFERVRSEIIRPESKRYLYELSNEDSYIYMLAHAYKHYNESGFGLRTIADSWLYRKNKQMDHQTVMEKFDSLQILDFSNALESIGNKMFDNDNTFLFSDLSEHEFMMMDIVMNAGKLGNREMYYTRFYQQFVQKNGSDSLSRYWIGRLFPDMEPYKNKYPFLYTHKILHPLFYIVRPINSLFKNRNGIKNEMAVVKKQRDKQRNNSTDTKEVNDDEQE